MYLCVRILCICSSYCLIKHELFQIIMLVYAQNLNVGLRVSYLHPMVFNLKVTMNQKLDKVWNSPLIKDFRQLTKKTY